jgi:hypothetical protein
VSQFHQKATSARGIELFGFVTEVVKSTSNTLRSMVTCPSCGEDVKRVEATGSIDDPKIIENVVAIMEGRDASRARKRRYRIEGPSSVTALFSTCYYAPTTHDQRKATA